MYEHRQKPIESTESTISGRPDGTLAIEFNHSHLNKPTFSIFPSMVSLSLPESPKVDRVPNEQHIIQDFKRDGEALLL